MGWVLPFPVPGLNHSPLFDEAHETRRVNCNLNLYNYSNRLSDLYSSEINRTILKVMFHPTQWIVREVNITSIH